jgi:hypothetical protein
VPSKAQQQKGEQSEIFSLPPSYNKLQEHSAQRIAQLFIMKAQYISICVMAFMTTLSVAFLSQASTLQEVRTLIACSSKALAGSTTSGSDTGGIIDSNPRPYFERTIESERLYKRLAAVPSQITCLTGPRNCGQTAVLQHYMHRHGSWHSSYINGRGTDIQTPDGFAYALDCCLAKLVKRVPEQQWQQLKRQWEVSLLYALPTETTCSCKTV